MVNTSLRTIAFHFSLLCLVLIQGCQSNQTHQFAIHIFGTSVSITLRSTPDQALAAEQMIKQTFDDFHRQWHAWQTPSILTQINTAIAQQQPIKLSNPVKAFLQRITMLSQQSDFLFNPAIGHLIEDWGFHSDLWQGPPPSTVQIQQRLAQQPSMKDLEWQGQILISHNPHVKLDLGGVAKGLAATLAKAQLLKLGISHAIINIGGDVTVLGNNQNQPWRIGIRDPLFPKQAMLTLVLCDGQSIYTSGTYERTYTWQNQSFHHIINPNTGYPSTNWVSSSVISDDPILADVAATALLVSGTAWQRIAQSLNVDHVILIDENRKIHQKKFSKNSTC